MTSNRRILALLLLGSLVLVLLSLLFLRRHHRAELERYKATLRAAGHLKTLAEVHPAPLTNLLNGGPALTDLMSRMPSLPSELLPGFGRGFAAGTRRVNWSQATLPTEERTNIWPELREFLSTNAASLAALRKILEAPVLEFPLRYEDGCQMLLPHLAKAKGTVQLLSADASLQLHDSRPQLALADTIAGVHLTARWNREPILITELVRIAIAAILANTTWEDLQFHGWSDADLAALQTAWQELDLPASAEAALGFEAAEMVDAIEHLTRADYGQFVGVMGGSGNQASDSFLGFVELFWEYPKTGAELFLDRYPRWWAFLIWQRYQVEKVMLQQIEAVRLAQRAAVDRGAWREALREAATNVSQFNVSTSSPMASLLDTDEAYVNSMKKLAGIEAQRSLVLAAIALERHRLRHGAYPARLDALAPEFLPALPRDPMDGQPVRYRLNDDGTFTLYTIGENGVDDGGDPTPAGASAYWQNGKDIVWPKPAAQAQVDAYRDALIQQFLSRGNPSAVPGLVNLFRQRYGLGPPPPPQINAPPAPAAR